MFLKWKERGRSFNEDLRNSKGYRNPDFLQLAVVHQKIDEIGSCFDPKIFDPHGYDKSDFADALGTLNTLVYVNSRQLYLFRQLLLVDHLEVHQHGFYIE